MTGPLPTHRLDVVPMLALSDVVTVGVIAVGPSSRLARTMYPEAGVRRNALRMVNYHRLHDGRRVANPSLVAASGGGPLPANPTAVEEERIGRSIEAFRYVALLANRSGHGPNSTHLQLENYRFRDGRSRYLTIRSRFTNAMGISNHQQRAWGHISPVYLHSSNLDATLLHGLGEAVRGRSKLARRLWRALWWFNQAHHDDPYQPLEFSILSLATAFEALVRPSNKVADLKKAVGEAIGGNELDRWVQEFYGSRSAISHGDAAWQPMFGAHAHVDHYRIAKFVFPLLVEQRLAELRVRQPPDPFNLAMRRLHITNLLSSDEELIARLLPLAFTDLKLRRNHAARQDVRFLPVRLNHEDFSTFPARYAELLAWVRRIAVSACRSAYQRYPTERTEFRALAARFEGGIPELAGSRYIPPGVDVNAYFGELDRRPERRELLEGISLVELAEAMSAIDSRRQMTELRF